MARSFNSNSFIEDESESAEDADPRIGLVNLADVMLVFACGLMLALVTYWNLDVSTLTEVVQTAEVTEVDDIEALQDEINGAGTGYEELGMVYKDPMTGKLYMMEEDLGTNEAANVNAGESEQPNTDVGNTQNPEAQAAAPVEE